MLCLITSFFFLTNNISLYRFTTPYLSMYQLVDIWVLSTVVNSASVNVSASVLVWTYVLCFPGVHWSGVAGPYGPPLWGSARQFPEAAAPFCIPTSRVWGFQFLHIHANTCYYLSFLRIAIPLSVQWYLTVVLTYTSLMVGDKDGIFICSQFIFEYLSPL